MGNLRQIRQTLPPVVFRAVILEEQGSPYTLSTHLTAQGAADRLAAERRKFNPNCKEECWTWIETVRDEIVIDKTYVDVGIKSEAEECAV